MYTYIHEVHEILSYYETPQYYLYIQIYIIAYPIKVPTMQEKRMTNTPKTEMVVSSLLTFNQSNMRNLGVDDSVKMPGSWIYYIASQYFTFSKSPSTQHSRPIGMMEKALQYNTGPHTEFIFTVEVRLLP
jgi:hypothetical protein